MPQIDLEPEQYQVRHEGRWVRRDNKKLAMVGFFVALAMLAFVYWNRAEFQPSTLFGLAAMIGFGAGGLLAIWLKDVY